MDNRSILVVDDDEFVLFFVERALQHLGFTVDCVSSCEEGLERYEQRHTNGTPFRAVITDISIPGGMGGEELASRLRERYPDALVFVSSGHPDSPCMRYPAGLGSPCGDIDCTELNFGGPAGLGSPCGDVLIGTRLDFRRNPNRPYANRRSPDHVSTPTVLQPKICIRLPMAKFVDAPLVSN